MDTILNGYMNEVKKYPLLTCEQENALALRIQKGDSKAVTELVNGNLRLVLSVAKKFTAGKVEMMDLIQEGSIGLVQAAQKFRSSFNTHFSTYAYPWVLQYMLRYANSKSSLISIPHRKNELKHRVEQAQAYLFQKTGHEATCSELALYLDVPEEEMRRVMIYSYSISSLDVQCGDDSCTTVSDLIADTTFSPETIVMTEEKKRLIRQLMDILPSKEKQVIWLRFNFDNDEKVKTLRQVSEIMGCSTECVRQLELRALKHMKALAEMEEELMFA